MTHGYDSNIYKLSVKQVLENDAPGDSAGPLSCLAIKTSSQGAILAVGGAQE